MRVDCCEADCWQDVDEGPAPGVVPEGEGDGRVLDHVKGVQEVGGKQAPPRDHVTFEVPEHLRVGSLFGAVGEEGRVAGEERLGEEEEGEEEGGVSANSTEVVVPLPAFCLA